MDESSSVTSTTSSTSVTLTADTSPGGGSSSSSQMVSVRIYVPELNVQKVIHFHREELVWNVKQQCLATLPKELKESFNYGLFYPPSNGRAGKFLDEERPLSDYPFNGPGGYLELKYKRRVYKMLHLDEKQLRSLHTRVNLRRFFDYVTSAQTEKIAKMCAKGLDPNIHCQETGETPLTIAAVSARPGPLLLALVGGGALIDYRTRCGSTALHRAAEKNNIEAVRTLLDLGASPNYRDAKNLTPLWNAVSCRASPMLCQALLHDYSIHGVQDAQGWHEVHQACRNGLVQHLENLLFYGAEMNAKNASGNTPLHVCAVDNQEACARLLLFRGADREALNFANQTPYQVAVIAGNLELAALIHRFRTEDVVPFKEVPSFNPRRRMSMASMRHSMSSSSVMHLMASAGDNASSIGSSSTTGSSGTPSPTLVYSRPLMLRRQAPSPSPSQSHWLDHSHLQFSNCSTVSVRSDTGSSCTAESEDGNGSSLTDKISVDQCDVVSDSSGVGTSNSGSGGSYDANRPHSDQQQSLVLPGMTVVCTEAYSSKEASHLSLQPGDIIEVTGSTDCGLLEGWLRGDSGFFPPHCVQEVRLRHPAAIAAARQHPSPASSVIIAHKPPPPPPPSSQPPGIPSTMGITLPMAPQPLPLGKTIEARAAGRREMVTQNYGTTPRMKQVHGEPRTVILHKGQRGFGFVLRGAKMTSNKDMQPIQHRVPALQYLDSVEAGSVADRAGLRPGDFILAINGEDLAQASHEKVVDCIRRSGNLVQLTICSAISSNQQQQPIRQPEYATIGNGSSNNTSRQYSTLPRKLSSNRPPQPPKRDPRTTLSVGRARARSMVVALNEMDASQSSAEGGEEVYANGTTSRTASIRSRSGSGRVSTTDLERLTIPTAVAPPAPPTSGQSSPRSPRIYASVAEMKRMRKLKGSTELLKLHKEFHSTPELCWEQENGEVMTSSWAPDPMEVIQMQSLAASEALPPVGNTTEDWHKSHSQEDVYRGLKLKAQNERNSRRSWAMANNQKQTGRWAAGKASKKKGPAVPSGVTAASRYHGSWHNIEASSHGDEEDDEETEGDIDDDDEDDEEAATPIAEQLTLLGNGEYRAVKTCRPVYATGLSNTLPRRAGSPHCAAPPPSHPPPPPPPPSQVIRVDVAKSHGEYAAAAAVLCVPTPGGGGVGGAGGGDRPTTPVMSSFRPSDNAKLYALPQDPRNVGYSTLRPTKKPPASTLTTPSTPPANSTVTSSRSKSLPPRSGRPSLVTVKSDETDNRPRVSVTVNSTPLIPDPDYGSEDEPEEEEEHQVSTERQGRKMEKGMPKSQSFCTDILKAKSLLKASISYPEELNDCQQQEQQQQPEESYVTFVPVNGEQQQRTGGNGRRAVTRHAVSLIQLPPPVENGENDSSSSDERTLQQMIVNGGNEQDSVSTISTLSSLSTSSNSSDRDATIMETRNGRLMNEAERTIEESLQLIRKHVDELSGMNHRPGSNGKSARALLFPHQHQQQPDSDDEGGFLPPPPPEFSDATGGQQHMMKLQQQQSSPSRQMLPKSMSSGHIRSCAINDDRRVIERRLSDEVIGSQMGNNRPSTVRVVGAVPKKVSFSPEVIDAETQRGQYQQLQQQQQQQLRGGHFASKPLLEWNLHDTADWLDSLFLNEYKATFVKRSVDGQALARINTETLLGLGVKKLGHRVNIEKSLKHYAAKN